MALTRTALQLTADVRNRCDQVASSFRTNPQIYRYLSESCRSVVSRLVDEFEALYWAKSFGLNVAANAASTGLNANVWKVVMLRTTLNGERVKIGKAPIDAVDMEAASLGGWGAGSPPRYHLLGRELYWVPIPRADTVVTVWGVHNDIFYARDASQKSELTEPDDYFDGIFGWEQIAVLEAAIKVKRDAEKDTSELRLELADRWEEAREAARDAHGTDAPRVRDTYGEGGDYL